MTVAAPGNGSFGFSPAELRRVDLDPERQALLARATAEARGDAPWRARKEREAHDLLAAAQVGPEGRFEVDRLDLREDIRVVVRLDVPVALRAGDDGEPVIARGAIVGIAYPRLLVSQAIPGTSAACLLWPALGAFHPNILVDRGQPLCFGPRIEPAIPLIELALSSYALLSMQNVMLDAGDSAGVLNREAAEWWHAHQDRMPLTRTPFFGPPDEGEVPPCS